MMKYARVTSVGLLAAALSMSGHAAAQNTTTAKEADETQEIVVTALKQGPQSLTDTPAAVSVITGATMEDAGARSLVDVVQSTPGVSISNTTVAGSTSIAIRGVNSTFGSATVGFYLDDLPFSLINVNFLPDPSPYDLDRVEILRGPQGSLYGAGASGGVVLVRTMDPSLDSFEAKTEGRISGTTGAGENYMVSGAVNIPIASDRAALRIAGSYNDDSGWIDAPSRRLSDYNFERRLNLRGKFRFVPFDRMTVQLQAAISRIDAGGSNSADDDDNWYGVPDARTSTNYDQYGGVVNYDFGNAILTSTTSFLNWSTTFDGGFVVPIPSTLDADIFSQELRLSSSGKRDFSWVIGAFYKDARASAFNDLSAAGSPINLDETTRSKQGTVYGQGTLSTFDHTLDLTVGASYFHDRTSNQSVSVPVSNRASTDRFSPKASIGYHPVPNATLYASYTRGFRPATVDYAFSTFFARLVAPSITGLVGTEDLTAYELGAKADILDGKIHLEVALFRNDIKDIQQSAAVIVPGASVSANTVLNAGDARTSGFEWVIATRPTRALSVNFSGSYTKTEIRNDFFAPGADPATATPLFSKGSPLNLVPKWQVAFTVAHKHNLGSLEGKVSAGLQLASKRSLTVLSAPSIYGDDNLRLDARYEIGRGTWKVFVFGENLTNDHGAIAPSAYTPFFNLLGFPQKGITASRFRPRTIGIGARLNF
ncbi:TonB-dependent receptor [Sphingomonas sp. So64.6b]|uniref:TonB-dependent receptor n=1 Tax=Sphingomonas sp. So64.6b TaxID=2997354 RepID=UPI0016017FC4|nr:TonB-dependent receptor [Sphingomonas sp. So64.6b]QNA85526.1 TonB-dependent receptor [Sphingomonas sp. So64.6b]